MQVYVIHRNYTNRDNRDAYEICDDEPVFLDQVDADKRVDELNAPAVEERVAEINARNARTVAARAGHQRIYDLGLRNDPPDQTPLPLPVVDVHRLDPYYDTEPMDLVLGSGLLGQTIAELMNDEAGQ